MLCLENESKDMLDKATKSSDVSRESKEDSLKSLRRPFGMDKKHEEVSDQVFDSALSKGRDMLKEPEKYLGGKNSKDYIRDLKDQTNVINNWIENPINRKYFTLEQIETNQMNRKEVHKKYLDYKSLLKSFSNNKRSFEQEFKDAAQQYLDYVHQSIFPDHKFATSEEGRGYFADSAGQNFLRSRYGGDFLSREGVELAKTEGGVGIVKSEAGQDFLRSEKGEYFLYEKGVELARTDGGVDIVKSEAGQDFLRSGYGRGFLYEKGVELAKMDRGMRILESEAGQDFLRSRDGSGFLFANGVELAKTEGGVGIVKSEAGQDFLRSGYGRGFLFTNGVELAKTDGGMRILESGVGQDFLKSEKGEEFLFANGVELAKTDGGMRILESEVGQDFLKSEKGEEFLDEHHDVFAATSVGEKYFATEVGQEYLQQREVGRKWSGQYDLAGMYKDVYEENPSSDQDNDYIQMERNITRIVERHWYSVPKDSRKKTYQVLDQAFDRAKWLENNEGRFMIDPTGQQSSFVIIDASHTRKIEAGTYKEADPAAVETYRNELSTQQNDLKGQKGMDAILELALLNETVNAFEKRYPKPDPSE